MLTAVLLMAFKIEFGRKVAPVIVTLILCNQRQAHRRRPQVILHQPDFLCAEIMMFTQQGRSDLPIPQ